MTSGSLFYQQTQGNREGTNALTTLLAGTFGLNFIRGMICGVSPRLGVGVDPALPGLETDRTLGPGAEAEGVRASAVGAGAAAGFGGAVLAASTRDVRPLAGGLRGGSDILGCVVGRRTFDKWTIVMNQLLNFCFRGSTLPGLSRVSMH